MDSGKHCLWIVLLKESNEDDEFPKNILEHSIGRRAAAAITAPAAAYPDGWMDTLSSSTANTAIASA